MPNFFQGNKFIGPAYFEFDGVDYGFSVGDAEVEFVEDVADIFSAQFGTQPYDKTVTGQALLVRISYGEVDNELVAAMNRGITLSSSGNAMKMGCEKYQSGYLNYAKQLKLTAPAETGCDLPSTDPNARLLFLKAMPSPTGPIMYGPETQRQMDIEFYVFMDRDLKIFGFTGTQTSNGLSGITIL